MSNQLFEPNHSDQPKIWQASRAVLITSLVVAAAVVGIRQLGVLQSLELNGFDQLVRLQPDRGPDDRLLIVGVPEEDIKGRNEYPLTDRTITALLDKLEQSEPQAIGLDIIRDVPQPKGDQNGHQGLLKLLQTSDRTVVVCKTSDANSAGFSAPKLLKEQADAQVGAVNLGVDPDGVVRRALLTITPAKNVKAAQVGTSNLCDQPPNPDNPVVPYFGLQLALMYLAETKGIQPEQTSSGYLKLGPTVFQPLESYSGPYRSNEIGGRQGYQMLIDYRSADHVAKQVSLTDVLSGKVDPKFIKDRIVLIGYTARSVHDEFVTPYGQATRPPMPGVVVHAQIISQLLNHVLDQRPLFWFSPQWGDALWIFGWAVVGGFLSWKLLRPVYLLPAIAVAIAVLYAICWGLFSLFAGWVPLVPPVLAFLLTAAGVVFFSRGYAQALYQGVKGFLKLDIDIDHEKKEQAVAEITESDFFQGIKEKAEKIRRDRTETPPLEEPVSPIASSFVVNPIQPPPPPEQSNDLDYLNHLQRRGKGMRQRHEQPPDPHEQPTPDSHIDDSSLASEAASVQQPVRTEATLEPELIAYALDSISTTPLPSPQLPATTQYSEFDFLPPIPASHDSPQPQFNHSRSALIQLHREVDEYYQQLKQQREADDRARGPGK